MPLGSRTIVNVIEGDNTSENLIGDTGLTGAINDFISGLGGDDTLQGLTGDDTLNGGMRTNSLLGGVGGDCLIVNTSSGGVLDGGDDNDRFVITGSLQNSAIIGGSGNDTLEIGLRSSGNPGLTGTTITGIEATEITTNRQTRIDAAEIANLGVIALSDEADSNGADI